MRRQRASVLVAGVLTCFGVAAACNRLSGLDALSYDLTRDGGGGSSSSTGSSSTGSGTAGSSSTGSSSTGGPMCTTAADCAATPVPPGPCASLGAPACNNGVCGVKYTAGKAPSQVYGDCKKNLCSADGTLTKVTDDSNAYLNADDCFTNGCTAGMPTTTSLNAGSACALSPPKMGVCEYNSANTLVCSQCGGTATSMCTVMLPSCWQNQCVGAMCGDGNKNAGETDTDCGGPNCVRCPGSKACNMGTDCQSDVCLNNMCVDVSCSDGYQDGTETDVDCGGGCPKACADGKKCALPTDCQSGVCMPGTPTPMLPLLCHAPSCIDGVQNGTETGVDCGGTGYDGGAPCPPCGM